MLLRRRSGVGSLQAVIQQLSHHRSRPDTIAQDVADAVVGLLELGSPRVGVPTLLLSAPGVAAHGMVAALSAQHRGRIIVATAGAALPFTDSCLDLAIALFPRDRLPAARKALAELYRTLRPGGRLIAAVIADGESPDVTTGGAAGGAAVAWCRTIEEHGLDIDVTVTTRDDRWSGLPADPGRAGAAPSVRHVAQVARYVELPPVWSSLVIGCLRVLDA